MISSAMHINSEPNIRKRNTKIRRNEIREFLKNNYISLGIRPCADALGISQKLVSWYAANLGLSISPIIKAKRARDTMMNGRGGIKVPIENIKNVNENVAYILGLIYADGTINRWTVSVSVAEDDLKEVVPVFMSIGDWSVTKTPMTARSRKQLLTIRTSNIDIINFLKENDYHIKSTAPQSKILNHIPENLHYMFWRGYFDGDAHCGKSKFSISSNINQDWSSVEKLFGSLKISYRIFNRTHKNKDRDNSHSSVIEINKNGHVTALYDYIYQHNRSIGFTRKHNQYKSKVSRYHQSIKESKYSFNEL
jgi:hypothetical protein